MKQLPRAAALYVVLIFTTGALVLAANARYLPRDPAMLAAAAGFALLAALCEHKRLVLMGGANHSVAVAVEFASAIIFGAPTATWVSGIGSAASDLYGRKPLHKMAFNIGAVSFSVFAAATVLDRLRVTPAGTASPGDLPAYIAYAATHMVVNHSLVFVVIGLEKRIRAWDVAMSNYQGMFVPVVALFPIGVLMAVTYLGFGQWTGLVLLAVPTVAVYSALQRAQDLRAHTQTMIEALADALDQRDRYTAEHSRRVANYAEQIAVELKLPLLQRETIKAAARVHDLGKISTPDAVLHKPDELDDDEWHIMREHPKVGAEILSKLPMYREHALLVEYHHERLDGTGYPHRLAAGALPLGAQVLAVADAFDAMTTDRPYRTAVPVSTALARLRCDAGTQFSPLVVEALARALGLDTAGDQQGSPTAGVLAPQPASTAGA